MRKIKNISISVVAFSAIFIIFAACSGNNINQNSSKDEVAQVAETISAKDAKELIDNNPLAIILDVRTKEEFDEGHIKNAILIPDNEIEDTAPKTLKNKSALILVYCRSGRRSAIAANKLVAMGYTNVKDFGGIIDWQYSTTK